MKDHNQDLTDKNIRDLLKWRLLEQVEDGDLLTQQLTDMEAKLVFGTGAQLTPSLQKEKELLLKLTGAKNNIPFFKWLLPAILTGVVAAVLLYYYSASPGQTPQVNNSAAVVQKNNPPENAINTGVVEDSLATEKKSIPAPQLNAVPASDTLKPLEEPKWLASDAGIKVDYHPLPRKLKFADNEQSVPSLNEKEIEANNKLKEKMIKQLIKKDKNAWAYVPMGSGVFYGDTVSMRGFYMSATEVTNKQYRVFLNDLLINGRTDDYLKAVPDTAKWLIDGNKLYEPMMKNYFWHPAYDNYPVVCVPRAGAEMYCVWLTIETNKKIKEDHSGAKDLNSLYINDLRIPAESEWMMAARGGTNNLYPWGTDKIQNARGCFLCNFWVPKSKADSMATASCNLKGAPDPGVPDGLFFTGPVNVYNPNSYGLYCMAGNAAEMVYKDNWKEEMKLKVYKPGKPATKGGSWYSDADHVKVDAAAEDVDVTEGLPYVGFRPVFTAVKK